MWRCLGARHGAPDADSALQIAGVSQAEAAPTIAADSAGAERRSRWLLAVVWHFGTTARISLSAIIMPFAAR
jgi:hypothetical protein